MVTKEQIEELIDSFVESEHFYYGATEDCIVAAKVPRLAAELFDLINKSTEEN